MRIAIMGAGGVGGYFGAALAKAGQDVTFIARGRHLEAILERGLTIASETGEFTIDPAQATDDPATVGPVDVVLFCVKLYDTGPAAKACLPLIGKDTIVITLQNGVESVEDLARIVGSDRVVGGAVYIVVSIVAPGVIRRTGPSDLMEIGVPDTVGGDTAGRFAEVCRGAGINLKVSQNMRRMLWRKFILLAASASMTGLTRQTVGVVREDPVMREMMIASIAETAAVGRALDVDFADDVEQSVLYQLDNVVGAGAKSSQLVDLEHGRRLELEWLSGAIHKLGRKTGVPTPVHTAAYAALKPFAGGGGA